MGKWIKKTAVTPISSESKIINDFNTEEDPNTNGFSIAVIKTLYEASGALMRLYVDSNFMKWRYIEVENPEQYITIRSGDSISRLSLVRNMNTWYFSIILQLNADVESGATIFTLSHNVGELVLNPTYDFDTITAVGSNARSITYDAENRTFYNSGATITAGQYIRISTTWAIGR